MSQLVEISKTSGVGRKAPNVKDFFCKTFPQELKRLSEFQEKKKTFTNFCKYHSGQCSTKLSNGTKRSSILTPRNEKLLQKFFKFASSWLAGGIFWALKSCHMSLCALVWDCLKLFSLLHASSRADACQKSNVKKVQRWDFFKKIYCP